MNGIDEQTEEAVHRMSALLSLYVKTLIEEGFTREEAVEIALTITIETLKIAGNQDNE